MNQVTSTLLDALTNACMKVGELEMGSVEYFKWCDIAADAEDRLRREITELEQRNADMLWELAGCLTIAEAQKPVSYQSANPCITLAAVNALAARVAEIDGVDTSRFEHALRVYGEHNQRLGEMLKSDDFPQTVLESYHEVVLLERAELIRMLLVGYERKACACAQPLIGERVGSHLRCRLCNGYITYMQIMALLDAHKPEIDALVAENAELGKRYNELANLVDRRMGELEAENERLRAALEAVEYADMELRCPWCDNWYDKGHAPNCQRQSRLDANGA